MTRPIVPLFRPPIDTGECCGECAEVERLIDQAMQPDLFVDNPELPSPPRLATSEAGWWYWPAVVIAVGILTWILVGICRV